MKGEPRRDRVAMVGYTFYESDARLQMYVEYLVSSGYDVDVVVVKDPNCTPPVNDEHVSFYFPQKRRFERQGFMQFMLDYSLFTLACAFILLKNHLGRQRYSVVHINNMPNFVLFAALPVRLLGARILLDIHDTMPEIFRFRRGVPENHWLIRCLKFEEWICLKLADYVITSEHTKRDRLLMNGLKPSKSNVILNLANPDLFPETPDAPPAAAEAGRPFRVVYHGTLTKRLGVDTVLRAVAIARRDVPSIRFEITGDGEQRAELVALATELGIESHVVFSKGFVPVDELHERIAGADLGVMASRVNPATDLMLPVKLLEYVRLGIPCVAVRTRTILHYFSEPAVRFIPPDDPEALAAVMVDLHRNPRAREEMARRARAFYSKYDFDAQGRLYIEIVQGLGERRAPVLEVI